jgi:hypothetical protein
LNVTRLSRTAAGYQSVQPKQSHDFRAVILPAPAMTVHIVIALP